ncbi:Villin-1 [Lamellibrachia satsuma]|nr:Villin-1 [Lamellibrachia satsuma]
MSESAVDPAFKVIPKVAECFLIWRIENFAPVAVPKNKYGSFYDGDAYLVLSVKKSSGRLGMCIHYWIGEKATQDESGTVAIKAIELDDYLGGTPVQYREVQGFESKVFLNHFKGGIKYMPGGITSGFSHVDYKIKPRLFHLKGKSCPRIKELPIGWDQMNDGDTFILDVGTALFVWNGKTCSRTERIKAMEYARKLRDDRGKGNIVVVEDGEENAEQMGADELELFEEYLPLSDKSSLQSASEVPPDDVYERKAASQLKLWKCSDESGELQVTEVGEKPLKREMLDTNDTFIVDNGDAGIWVWCGRKSNPKEKKEAMANATAFLTQHNYSNHVQMVKVHETGEPSEFKALFRVWEKPLLPGQLKPHSNSKIAATIQTNFTASTMHDNPSIARDTGMVDDGTGKKVVYRVERTGRTYELKVIEEQNQLFGGDSYVIPYTYRDGGKENYIIYFWLGKKSTQDERGIAAKKTVEMDDELNGAAKQVRVVQGKEPNHFMAMFGGKLIIYSGGKAGWGQTKDEGPGDTYLLHVRGVSQYNTKAEQVPLTAESLNSNDVFVLIVKSKAIIWAGKGSSGDEREMAKQLAQKCPKGYTLVSEGQEKDDFWEAIGGQKPYSSSPSLMANNEDRPPRLFQCSNASGAFTVNEIVEFTQGVSCLQDRQVTIIELYMNLWHCLLREFMSARLFLPKRIHETLNILVPQNI